MHSPACDMHSNLTELNHTSIYDNLHTFAKKYST